jgi:hypothetical protein
MMEGWSVYGTCHSRERSYPPALHIRRSGLYRVLQNSASSPDIEVFSMVESNGSYTRAV